MRPLFDHLYILTSVQRFRVTYYPISCLTSNPQFSEAHTPHSTLTFLYYSLGILVREKKIHDMVNSLLPNINPSPENVEATHRADSIYSVLVVTAVILASLLNVFLHAKRLSRFFPESGASILFGMLMGVLLKLSGRMNTVKDFFFKPEMFYFVLLPPIIFEAGFSMKQVCLMSLL